MSLLSKLLRQTKFVKCSRYFSNQDHIIKSKQQDIQIPSVTIHDFLTDKCEKFAKFTAIECAITGRNYTYDQIITKSRNLNKSLRKKLQLQRNDVISVFLPNSPEFPIVVFGTLQAGLILTTLNPMYTSEEVARQLLDSGTKTIITIPELYASAKGAVDLTKKQIPIILIKNKEGSSLPSDVINFEEFVSQTCDIENVAPIDPESTAVLPYSSGTTGFPKGVELSHRNIVANISQVSVEELQIINDATDSHQDVIPAILPMFHIYGFTVNLLSTLNSGCKVVTLPKFTPETYIAMLKKYPANIIFAAPPLVLFLSLHPEVKAEYLQHCRTLMCGAAPLGALDEERIREKVGQNLRVFQGYGLTETSPVCLMNTGEGCKGAVGRPIPSTEAKVVSIEDPSFPSLGPNQTGELWIRGPQVMKGYYKKPEQTAECFYGDWFRTGDLVHYDDNDYFFVTDRLKELIKVKGFQVAPAELEEIIRAFPNVADAAVIGIPHEITGEVPRAYVVPKQPGNFNINELDRFVADKVAPYKKLKGGIEIVSSIPKNASGKILRRIIKLEYKSKHSSS